MLQLEKTRKEYNGVKIVDVPFLQLPGGIYWVKGANGSGKTTLLKMIAGLLPFEGNILFSGTSLRSEPLQYRRRVSWAEAEPLYPEFMNGMDLISLHQNIRKAPGAQVAMLVALFNMEGYVKQAIGTYSARMTKKLSLLLAFLGNTPLVILDEPLITLDPESLAKVCGFILEKHNNAGTTFLMSSHQDLDTGLLLSEKELIVGNHTVLC